MKKIFILLLIVLLLGGCTKVPSDMNNENESLARGEYKIYNSLSSKITELYLYETGKDKGDNLVEGNGLNVNGNITLAYDGHEDTVLTLEYVAEDGDSAKFETLHVEVANMNIIPVDERTGPTMISWDAPEGDGEYTIYNITGGKVIELYIYEVGKDKGVNEAKDGLADGESVVVKRHGNTKSIWCLEFKADNGEEGIFETLSIEVAPICLLASDARTGATDISFSVPE